MEGILGLLEGQEVRRFEAGENVITQGARTARLYFLIEGSVEVLKDDVRVATSAQSGSVFGELSALLDCEHTATVRALQPCAFYVVGAAREFLNSSPPLCLHVCELLARRLDALNKYLVDVKHQFDGHDHLGMVDEVIETLMHRQPRRRVLPDPSTRVNVEPGD